ncbi:uncharacterized protein LOC130449858 [Diorhabda sublineata]|uniref:uncharacterized protein LOC130449858 n=1 Tax=Diorhabda sublineata TaxID=1163346 RepID=UPI0024E14E92|nr:uncharacterized protein LOC130449858 [Diorhabda sublineata]
MTIDLYYVPGGAPSRNVLLAAKAVGVELNLIRLDLMKGEHLSPEFLKINPQHTVPTLNDNGFALWESRAIMTYLADQYGKDDSLYPKDPKKRAIVDQRLYFDMGTLFASFADYYYPMIFMGASADSAKFENIGKAFEFLDKFVGNSDFAAGNNLTLADLALVSTVSSFDIMDYDLTPYKNVVRWYAKVKKTAPGYEEANEKNLKEFKALVDQLTIFTYCVNKLDVSALLCLSEDSVIVKCTKLTLRYSGVRFSPFITLVRIRLRSTPKALAASNTLREVAAPAATFLYLCALYSAIISKPTITMTIDLYYIPGAAPSRNVLLAAKAVGVELNLKRVNVMKGEQLTPEFVKLNPQHTLPTLNDNGFVLWESRAIMTYLADKYAKNDSLYPKDVQKRALVDQRLYFDMGTLYASFFDYYIPVIFRGASIDPAKYEKIGKAFEFLDTFIGNNDFAAGDNLTLADLSLVSTVSSFDIMDYDFSSYKNVVRWYGKVKATAPGYEEANARNVREFRVIADQVRKL